MEQVNITSATDGKLDNGNPAKATEAPKPKATKAKAQASTKGAKVTKVPAKKAKGSTGKAKSKVPTKFGRTSALADWMREHGINPKVGRAKLRRLGIARELTAEARKALLG